MKRRSRYSLSERFTNSFFNSFCTDSPMTSQPKEDNQARLMCIQRRITSAVQYWFIDIFCHTMMATFRSVKPFSWANSTKFLNCSDLLTARSMNMATENRSSSLTLIQNVGYWTSHWNWKFNYELRMRNYWVVLVSLARCLAVGQSAVLLHAPALLSMSLMLNPTSPLLLLSPAAGTVSSAELHI